jgi:hypothetical protein
MAPKKGAIHATLLPSLGVHCIPSDKDLAVLMDDERPVATWHVYFDGCNTSEEATGENELEAPKDVSWEAIQRPSLEDLERANDFKTPKKVRVLPNYLVGENEGVSFEVIRLDPIRPLDLTELSAIQDDPTPSQKAVRHIFHSWDDIRRNFQVLSRTMMTLEERAKGERDSSAVNRIRGIPQRRCWGKIPVAKC